VLPLWLHSHRDGISDTWLVPGLGRKKSLERNEQTWWAAPTFHWSWTDTSWNFNLHPLLYVQRSPEKDYVAALPFYFDFRNKKDKTQRFLVFPLYWDFKDFKIQKRGQVLFPFYWNLENGPKQRRARVLFPFHYDIDMRDRNARYTVTFPFYARSVVGDRTRHFVLNTVYEKRKDSERTWQFHFYPFVSRGGSAQGKWWSVLGGLASYEKRGKHRRGTAFWLPFRLADKP
jgi:hypothetical protein